VGVIRKLATEAADNGLLDPVLAAGIAKVRGVTGEGRRTGNWLTRDQAQALLYAPDTSTRKGLRDRAILAVLIGSGLRREEAANLTFDHIQQRDGRWAIVDIVGKRNKRRTVPIASWVKVAIDEWAREAELANGRVFRAVNKGDTVWGDGISSQAIWGVVAVYAERSELKIAPHDLRRTFAKLAHKGGSGIDQIQLSLGHASIKTTERYLGVEQDLTDAPGDHLGLRLE
jgi:integrase